MKSVITYHQLPRTGIMGSTLGADSHGDYAIIIESDDYVTLYDKSYNIAKELSRDPKIKNIVVVNEGAGYYDTIKVIKV